MAIPTHLKALKEIIFIFMIYSRPSRTRWYTFQKNSSQNFFIKIIESPLAYASSDTPPSHTLLDQNLDPRVCIFQMDAIASAFRVFLANNGPDRNPTAICI